MAESVARTNEMTPTCKINVLNILLRLSNDPIHHGLLISLCIFCLAFGGGCTAYFERQRCVKQINGQRDW